MVRIIVKGFAFNGKSIAKVYEYIIVRMIVKGFVSLTLRMIVRSSRINFYAKNGHQTLYE
jgi:hypothetical protein